MVDDRYTDAEDRKQKALLEVRGTLILHGSTMTHEHEKSLYLR